MDSKAKHAIFTILRIAASVFCAFAAYIVWAITLDDAASDLLYSYSGPRDYLGPVWDASTVAMIISAGIFLISMILIWKLFKLKWRLIVAGFITILIIGCGVCNAMQKNILELHSIGVLGDEISLSIYEPFYENTLAASLDTASSLTFEEHLPHLDGATALYPLYASFARATYPAAEYRVYRGDSAVTCSRTARAFENLLDGTADLIFLMGVSDEQRQQAEELGLELMLTPIGKEAFVFFVNKKNAMENLSVENIRDIYSGKVKFWREVGGNHSEILAYQRPDTSGSQVMLKEIMGDVPIVEAPEVNTYNMMMDMYKAVAYKNHKNALGYSFLYYIRDMIAENKIKFLSIDGVPPTAENIASGAYSFAHDFYAVTVVRTIMTEEEQARADNAQKLVEWICAPQGQSLVEKTGYVPLS